MGMTECCGNHGNDGMLRESWEWRNVSVITGMAKFQTALQVSEPM
nr:hypothetical protein NMALPHA522_0204 [Neisseria meningitidis alpha522]